MKKVKINWPPIFFPKNIRISSFQLPTTVARVGSNYYYLGVLPPRKNLVEKNRGSVFFAGLKVETTSHQGTVGSR